MSPIGRGTLPPTKGEVTLGLVAFELYKLDRYADGGWCDPNIRKAIKRILKLARSADRKDQPATHKRPSAPEIKPVRRSI